MPTILAHPAPSRRVSPAAEETELETIRRVGGELLRDKKAGLAFLKKHGFLDENGQLSARYRSK